MKYYIALFQKLKETYFSQSSKINDLVLICPSLRLYEIDDLELLKPQSLISDPTKIVGSIIKKQQVAYELNSIPYSTQFWDLNPNNTLFDAYRDILNLAKVKGLEKGLKNAADANNTVLFDKSKETKEYKAYQKQMALYEKSLDAIREHLALWDGLDTEEEKQNWNAQLSILKSKKDQSMAEWISKGNKEVVDEALKSVNKLSEADKFLDLFQTVKNNFQAAEKTDVVSLSSIHDINFIPYDFMNNDSGWTYLLLDKEELEALFLSAKNNSNQLPEDILRIDYDEKYIESIEMDYAFVHLQRNWFNTQIFNSPYFQWGEPQPVSDGKSVSADFKLPAYPKTMLLIKNLKINLNDAVSEQQVSDPNQIIHFGPMILKTQLFVNKNNERRFLKAVTNKEIIKSDQMNYLVRKANEVELNKIERVKTINQPLAASTRANLLREAILSKPQVNIISKIEIDKKQNIASNLVYRKSDMFVRVELPQVSSSSKVFFNINDCNSKKGIYKCALSIKGTDNNRVFEVETNELGQVAVLIPPGSYGVEARIDGYEVLKKDFVVQDASPLTLTYEMKREEIKFKSYFLVGMVCECIPKIAAK